MKLFYNYSIDCELPPDGRFGGPANWEAAEASVRGFIEVMTELGMRAGASLFVYPDVAMKQRALFREMADAGIEVALHLNGMRYSRLKKPAWLGSMSCAEQREAIRMAKADLEDAIGRRCLGYRACYTSANHDTFPICEELGFAWTSASSAGSCQSAAFACWRLGWRFPYHPSRQNKLIPGDLKLYEVPTTRGFRVLFNNNPDRPLDLRSETPPAIAGANGEAFRHIIEENLEAMEKCDQPVRTIIVGSHNTNPYADRSAHQHRHLVLTCRHVKELAAPRGLTLVPSGFMGIKEEADRIGAF